ncbi:STAS domain-containing protein [Marilutibacter penaei]|uniref:STAS domain-containing protein n=1 Tax=Marilutibacter penaei TaxID=2759900 RepID=UPI0031B60BBA
MPLDIDVYPPVNGNQYLKLSGRLDTHTYGQLQDALEDLLSDGPRALVLDMAHLEYISSAGIRCILQARQALAPKRGQVLVLHPQAQIRKVMDLARAVPLEAVFDTTEALDAYLDEVQRQVLEGLLGDERPAEDDFGH